MKTVVHIKCIELSSYGLKSINLNVTKHVLPFVTGVGTYDGDFTFFGERIHARRHSDKKLQIQMVPVVWLKLSQTQNFLI